MNNAPRHSAGDIARMLAGQILHLAPELLPGGRRNGQEWCVGGVDGSPGESCRVHLGGQKSGVWSDFATGESGDALDLVAAVLYRGDKKAAFAWALIWLGLAQPGHAAPATQRAFVPEKSAPAAPATDFRKAALALYLSAAPQLAGTPADLYLRGRGIDLSRLGRQPRALRFHPACWCTEAGTKLPALVAAVTDGAGQHVATHRTWLEQRGGQWGKARLKDPKMTLGRLCGGSIRLQRGASKKALKDAPAGETVVVGEGIETCLSVALACPDMRVLCAVSMSNAGSLALPDQIGAVVLLADNDGVRRLVAEGREDAARQGLARAIRHFQSTGRDVRLARSPWGKDFNDALRGVA